MFTLSLSERKLHLASLLYLSLPCILFLIGWVTPWLTLPLVAAIVFTIIRGTRHTGDVWQIQPHQALILLLVFFIVALPLLTTGLAGGYNTAWDITSFRQAMYRNLIDAPWPIVLPDGRELTYYIAGFLPTAMASRLVSNTDIQQWLLLLWSNVGTFLALLYFFHKRKRISWLLVLFFLFMSDPAWYFYCGTHWFSSALRYIAHLAAQPEWGGYDIALIADWPTFQTINSYQVTACAFNSLTPTLLVFAITQHVKRNALYILPLSLALLTMLSPLGAIGCVPFAAIAYLRVLQAEQKRPWLRASLWLIVPLSIVFINFIYFTRGNASTAVCFPAVVWGLFPFLIVYARILVTAVLFVLPFVHKIRKDKALLTTLICIVAFPLIYIGSSRELDAVHFNELWLKNYPIYAFEFAAALSLYWKEANYTKYFWLFWSTFIAVPFLYEAWTRYDPDIKVRDEWNGHICHMEPIMQQKIPNTHSPAINGILLNRDGESEDTFPGCLLPKAPGCDYSRPPAEQK